MKSLQQGLKQICEQYRVLTLYAFGSQAKRIRNFVAGHCEELSDEAIQ